MAESLTPQQATANRRKTRTLRRGGSWETSAPTAAEELDALINDTSTDEKTVVTTSDTKAETPLETIDELNARAAHVAHEIIDSKLAESTHVEIIDYIVDARQKDIDTGAAESVLIDKLDDLFTEQNMSLEEQDHLLDQISTYIYGKEQTEEGSREVAPIEEQPTFEAPRAIEAPHADVVEAEIIEEDSPLDERQAYVAQRIIELRREAKDNGQEVPSFQTAAEAAQHEYDTTHNIVTADVIDESEPADVEVRHSRKVINLKEYFSPLAIAARLQSRRMAKANERADMTPEQREKDMQKNGRRMIGAVAVAAVGMFMSAKYGMDHGFIGGDHATAASVDNLPALDMTNETFVPDTGTPAAEVPNDTVASTTGSGGGGEAAKQPTFSADALTVERGEGLNQTFKELGIPKDKWAETLQKAGPKLVKMGEAYTDPSIGGYGLNGDGKLSRSALRTITDVAKTIK